MNNTSISANWRGLSSSEVKSATSNNGDNSNSTRAYSAALRALKTKSGASNNSNTITSGGMIIP